MVISLIFNGVILVFSLGLLSISILSYRKLKNSKLLFVSVVFFLFFIKALVTVLSLFLGMMPEINPSIYALAIDLTVILLLYLATLKK